MDIKAALKAVTERHDLTREEMYSVMRSIMTGEATPAQIGGFLVGLRMKGETIDEIVASAEVMRELATAVEIKDPHLIDTCGTGGDGIHTFNISTCSAFVVAAAGGKVAKHGNRSVSSTSGSADVLEALGVNINLNVEQVADCIKEVGIGFMFAPLHHTAMKFAITPRREMGVRTIFNLLGPLTNPAKAQNQVMGVFALQWVEPIAQVLKQLGSQHVLVVHAEDGLDEISISAPTFVAELKAGKISTLTIQPEDFGLNTAPIENIQVHSVEESVNLLRRVLENEACPARDIVALNAGAAIYVAGLANNMEQGVVKALQVLEQGLAKAVLQNLVVKTQQYI
ncbi:MAG: anthranilate phosphoribosyltransferase [Thiotrichaceae bacterium]|nr:anthranilate phosphoribosyltransferase [Thiotrichaceae bacterium]